MKDDIIILANERIFYTIQGEGKHTGVPTVFVRLSKCNLRCAWKNADGSITQCDTPHTSFEPEVNEVRISDIIKEITEHGCDHVCISGGEPFFQKQTTALINALEALGHKVTVETNGTLYRESDASFISLSPKLSTSSSHPVYGKKHDLNRINIDALEKFTRNHDCQFKFVINTEEEIAEVLEIKKQLWERTSIDINNNIWLMPQGIENSQFDDKMEWLVEICKQYHWNLTDRMHIRIWGSRKGV